jgi:hypothetical protein
MVSDQGFRKVDDMYLHVICRTLTGSFRQMGRRQRRWRVARLEMSAMGTDEPAQETPSTIDTQQLQQQLQQDVQLGSKFRPRPNRILPESVRITVLSGSPVNP